MLKANMGLPIALNVFLTIDVDPTNGSMSINDLSVTVPICITSSESANIPISPGANIPKFAITHNSIAVVTNTPFLLVPSFAYNSLHQNCIP